MVREFHRSVSRLARGRGREPLQHPIVWSGRSRQWWQCGCRGRLTVMLTTTTTMCNKETINSVSSLEGNLPLFLIFS
jgi:hypothetical protein